MEEKKQKLFVESVCEKAINRVVGYTADVQAKFVQEVLSFTRPYDKSECCALSGLLVAIIIAVISPLLIRDGRDWIIVRIFLGLFAFWWMFGAFFYPVKVMLIDVPKGGDLKSSPRSIILLFVNLLEITIHFASVYILTRSITLSESVKYIKSPLDAIYFSVVTITTLGYGDYRAVNWVGKFFVSLEVIMGLVLIVTVLAGFIGYKNNNKSNGA